MYCDTCEMGGGLPGGSFVEWLQGRDDSAHVDTAGGPAADIMGRVALIPRPRSTVCLLKFRIVAPSRKSRP